MSRTWYFAEGSQGFFLTYLLLVNPQATPNDVTVRFLRERATPVTRTYTLQPHRRMTIDAGAIPEVVNRSFGIEVTFDEPAMAERAMYFGLDPLLNAGHASAGAPAPATEWFLAEGATGPFFETFVLIANPSAEAADVTVTFLPASGPPVTKTRPIPAGTRLTLNIEQEDPALANAAVATTVTSTQPVVVERAMYWPFAPDQWYEAHNSFGQTAAGTHWGLAEGRVGGAEGYQTFILLANPGADPADVTVRFLPTSGPTVSRVYRVQPRSRFNVAVGSTQTPPITGDFAAEIISTVPIMVERAMYWNSLAAAQPQRLEGRAAGADCCKANANGQVWAAGTNAAATRLP